MAEEASGGSPDADSPPRASKLSSVSYSSVENLSAACDDNQVSTLTSRSLPDISPRASQSTEKKSWESFLSSSSGTPGADENSLSILGLMDLYGMQNSLSGHTSTMPPLISPNSPSTTPLFSGVTMRSTVEDGGTVVTPVVKESPQTVRAAVAAAVGVQGSEIGGAVASSPPLERSYKTAAPPTLFDSMDRYQYFLEAPTSMMTPHDEDTLTYLNKGQFYCILFDANTNDVRRVRSVVQLVFREEKDARSELFHWEYWHSQQPNPSQRAFDVDRKACKNIDAFDDIAYNASSFMWETGSQARVVIRMNCLSTEFSPQKGVKGMPLFLQVDTFEDLSSDNDPAHRCYCKLKIFRDKGAERKNKDESRSADRRMAKILKAHTGQQQPVASPAGFFRAASKVTRLSPTSTFGRKSVLFIPSALTTTTRQPVFNNRAQSDLLMSIIKEREAKRTFSATLTHAKDQLDDLDVGSAPKLKVTRTDRTAPAGPSFYPPSTPAVTIYVRKDEEKVYNAIMLDQLTVAELCEHIGSKYGVPANTIKNVYKCTKKGILVNMEDRMVQMFANEDDFVIQLEFDNQVGYFKLILNY